MLKPTDYELDRPTIPEKIKEELYKKTDARWVIVSLSPRSAWVKEPTKMWFRSRFVYLMPLENKAPAYAAAIILQGEETKDTFNVLSTFLASLSWTKNIPLSIEHWGSGSRPTPIGYIGSSVSLLIPPQNIDRDVIPDPQDEKSRLALVFYREGLSINHIFYSFLSFFKIINLIKDKGKDQIEWINSKLDKLGYEAKRRLEEIKKTENDIGRYLYGSGRCAVSHAWSEPIADPDDLVDQERLRNDRILIKELSFTAIEENFGIKSPSSFYKDGTHRIQKLMDVLDQQFLEKGILKTTVPFIKLDIRGKNPNPLTNKLYFREIADFYNNTITINTFTENRRAIVRFIINLEKNDLFIDYNHAVYKLTTDDDRTNAEIDLNALILWRDYSMNGQIRIYSPEEELLASSTPYRPSLEIGRRISELNENIEAAKLKLAAFDAKAFSGS